MQPVTRFFVIAAIVVPFFSQAFPLSQSLTNDLIPGKYIVQLHPNTDIDSIAAHHSRARAIRAHSLARRAAAAPGEAVEKIYNFGNFKGYAGAFDPASIEELKALPEVLTVEQDSIMQVAQQCNNASTPGFVTQDNAPWGLASMSSRVQGASSYIYNANAGQGTYSYVIDSGIKITHLEFEGRAIWGFNAVNGTDDADYYGHGTHVAGTIGSVTYGVAKKTTLVAVKVFDGGSGPTSTVLSGFHWAANDIVAQNRTNTAVINMSITGPGSAIFDAAVTEVWKQGILAVVAAGNNNDYASEYSPARSPEVLTVGNINSSDWRAQGNTGSNFGSAVDIWAPGTDVLSTYWLSNRSTKIMTGTSMSSPHVAGLVSYLRSVEGHMSAEAVRARVLALATPGRVVDARDAANLLAYNGLCQTNNSMATNISVAARDAIKNGPKRGWALDESMYNN